MLFAFKGKNWVLLITQGGTVGDVNGLTPNFEGIIWFYCNVSTLTFQLTSLVASDNWDFTSQNILSLAKGEGGGGGR